MNIYLAGKISRNDWRHTIVSRLSEFEWKDESKMIPTHPIIPKSIFDYHNYVGPFFISCNHGCSHGDNTHGVGAGNTVTCTFHDEHYQKREAAFNLALEGIKKADTIFAWIESLDCYGTLVEIGYAYALGKHIWIDIPDPQNDKNFQHLWFATFSAPPLIYYHDGTAKGALRERLLLFNPKSLPYKEYLQTFHWKRLRTKKLEEYSSRCQLCNSSSYIQVHHRTYENLGNELLDDLTILCSNCHKKFHNKLL